MCNNKECADYFKSRRAYHRCLEELRRKWKSYGRVAGRIVLREASEEECRAIGGIVGKVFYGDEIRFSFAEFEQGLQRTRYAPVDMKSVLEEYFGERLSTNQGAREEEQERKSRFFRGLCDHFSESGGSGSAASHWMRAVASEKKYGYQLLAREYAKDAEAARALATNAGNALARLECAKE